MDFTRQCGLTEISLQIFFFVGCFLTATVVQFPTMKNTMANLWHPLKGVQISDLGGKQYLFRFFHELDLERLIIGTPWTFTNQLLVCHRLKEEDDPMEVPLVFSTFSVQVHDLPPKFFSKTMAKLFGDFIREFVYYYSKQLNQRMKNFLRIRVQIDICKSLKR